LQLLKQEVLKHPDNINERVLRAMHDVGVAGVKQYDPSPLGNAIGTVVSMLYYGIPQYKNLAPLRMDFGKGDPI